MKSPIDYSALFQAQIDFVNSGNAKLKNEKVKPFIKYKRRVKKGLPNDQS